MLICTRGPSGSGKSTWARAFALAHGMDVVETDLFMVNNKGEYEFDGRKLKHAHLACQSAARAALAAGRSVIVANTHIRLWEMDVYQQLASEFGTSFAVKELDGRYPNVHNVPEDIVNARRAAYEPTPESWQKL